MRQSCEQMASGIAKEDSPPGVRIVLPAQMDWFADGQSYMSDDFLM